MSVPRGRANLEHAARDLEDRDVEGATAEVVDRDALAVLLPEAVRERRCGRLVDDPLDVEAGDLSRSFGRGTLSVVEVGGHRHHRFGDLLAQISLGDVAHRLEDHRGDLGRRVVLATRVHPGVPVGVLDDPIRDELGVTPSFVRVVLLPHQALHRVDGALGIGDRLTLRHTADSALAIFRDGDDRRRGPGALRVGDDCGLTVIEERHTRVGRPQIDADDLTHVAQSLGGRATTTMAARSSFSPSRYPGITSDTMVPGGCSSVSTC